MLKDFVVPNSKETKFVFFSGKGGVGKSTMSCATAVWLSNQGYKTLLVTTDPAPNLSDIFGQEIGPKVTRIDHCISLDAIEIDPDTACEEYKERLIGPLRELLDEKNLKVIGEQLSSPCVEEVAAFDKFIEFMDDPQYDVVVFDTAPTGHTIRLLELPSGWSETLQNSASTCIGPGASLQSQKAKYEKAISYLQNSEKTSFIFVLKPETSSILETRRSTDELSKLGIVARSLIVNGVLPPEACTDDFFKQIKKGEEAAVERIMTEFPDLNKVLYPMRDSELSGLSLLESVGKYIYEGNKDEQVFNSPEIAQVDSHEIHFRKDLCDLMAPLNGSRYVFFTGKGGVGKSTIACTTAVHMAEKGFKTLIITTDPASHLHHIFGQKIEHEPTKINKVQNLHAARIDQRKALDEYRVRIMKAVENATEETIKSVEEDLNSPCAEEMAAFEKFMSYFELNDYDLTIFDTAPTGHTLRLLELPTDWKGFIDLGSLTKDTSEATKNKYADVIEAMRNSKRSTFVFVMYPEYTPIIEAWRASEDLKKQVGIDTAMVAVNYVLPSDYGKNSFFEKRRRQQEKYLIEIEKRFGKPLLMVPLQNQEPRGIDNLRRLGNIICG